MRASIQLIVDATASDVVLAPLDMSKTITGFSWDSRTVKPGSLYIAMPGERVDGNDYIKAAIKNGATVVLITRAPSEEEKALASQTQTTILQVKDALLALHQLASYYRENLMAKVIAITGSSGKTSTKELVSIVVSSIFNTVSSSGNQNNELGLPATILNADINTEILVTEMGMRGPGQIAELTQIARPSIGIITNIGQAHLELLGSKENIARAKSELIEALPDNYGVAILNGDDPYSSRIQEIADTAKRSIQVIQYGLGKHNDIRAENIEYDEQGRPSFDLWAGQAYPSRVVLALQGQHSVYNALAAAACGISLSMDVDTIAQALKSAQSQPMRQEMITLADNTIVLDDTYNANPDSMRAALEVLSKMDNERLHVAILGDMGELGSDEVELHKSIGEMVYCTNVDILISVGELAINYAEGAVGAGMDKDNVVFVEDIIGAAKVINELRSANKGSAPIVLVKASRFMKMEGLIESMHEYSVAKF